MSPTAADIFAPLPAIESFLDTWLTSLPDDRPLALREAIRYSAIGAGKRLRPILAWHACTAAAGTGPDTGPDTGKASLLAGAAIELVHCFSLIHDDLPALDNDDLRRGKPTLHKHTSEAMAILAGDQLLTDAFLLLTTHPHPISANTRLELLRELSHATSAMISGQIYDTLGGTPDNLSPLDRVQLVHNNKTGALIRAACRMGALCAPSPSPQTLEAITTYARAIGLMFQVVDDLIDVTQTAETAGKRTTKDAQAGKLTYPRVLGIEGTQKEIARLHAAAVTALAPLGNEADALRSIADFLATRTR